MRRWAEQCFYPWGEATRYTYGTQQTEYNFTGQRLDGSTDLLYHGARYYDPALRRWVQPDTLVPDPGNPQDLNRYTYVRNNPILYSDPSGHAFCIGVDCNLLENPATGNIMVRDVAASGLYALVARASVGQVSAAKRLEEVFDATYGVLDEVPLGLGRANRFAGRLTRTHFRGLGGVKGDAGFAPEFQDDWMYASLWGSSRHVSKQLGHFLTAVSMSYSGGDWLSAIVGHEQYADPWIPFQLATPTDADIQAFKIAVSRDATGDVQGRDRLLATILDPSSHGPLEYRQGNSMADLRLSVRGWRLGQMVAGGEIRGNRDLANWIALNVAGD